MTQLLEAMSITKHFQGPDGRQFAALSDVSFSVNPKDNLVLLGPSGCGKTTLLLISAGLLRPTSGQVLLRGKDLSLYSSLERSMLIGVVFQELHLVPYLNALDNVRLSSLTQPTPDGLERASGLLEQLGLKDRAYHLPKALSTGEKQRVALARALFHRPAVLLLDEPTSNLDEQNDAIVSDLLWQLRATSDVASITVTHNLRDAAREAGKVLSLNAGRVDFFGPASEYLSPDR
jgi:ABC-type lipoprotein export system ATPase subunit